MAKMALKNKRYGCVIGHGLMYSTLPEGKRIFSGRQSRTMKIRLTSVILLTQIRGNAVEY